MKKNYANNGAARGLVCRMYRAQAGGHRSASLRPLARVYARES